MVDTLADWMLRYPALFHALEIAAQVAVFAFFLAGWLFMLILPGRKHENTFPRRSKARFWWRVAWLVGAVLMADLVTGMQHHRHTLTAVDWTLLVSFYALLLYANLLGERHYKEWRRTHPPE